MSCERELQQLYKMVKSSYQHAETDVISCVAQEKLYKKVSQVTTPVRACSRDSIKQTVDVERCFCSVILFKEGLFFFFLSFLTFK